MAQLSMSGIVLAAEVGAGYGSSKVIRVIPMHNLEPGCGGEVVEVAGEREVRRRLLEMGFCRGAAVLLLCRAPLGDPIEFSIRGYCVSLRAAQAALVKVRTLSPASHAISSSVR